MGTWVWITPGVLAVLLLALLMLAGLLNRKREEDDESEGGNSLILRVAGLIPAVAAIALFMLTQDMSQPIVIVDVWSIPFALLASVDILLMAILALRGSDDGGTRRFAQSSA